MSNTVNVTNISSNVTESSIREFFSFCGKISSLTVNPSTGGPDSFQSAVVVFEKESAAKTALLLDETKLVTSQIHVTAVETSATPGSGAEQVDSDASKDDDVAQEDKPRSRVVAEYLAHGYVISDIAIERAIQLDVQHGISARFTATIKSFAERFHAVDQMYGVTDRAASAWHGMSSYFDKALETPTGRRLRTFYEAGNKQVMDVHNEARHLADLKANKDKNDTGSGKDLNLHQVEGTNRTKCNCNANLGICPCETGKCACNDCGKNPDTKPDA